MISAIQFTLASPAMTRTGLLGWVRATLNGHLGIDGLAVRRTRSGRLVVTFPTRIDGLGNEHALVWPLDQATRGEIEAQVFEALGLEVAP